MILNLALASAAVLGWGLCLAMFRVAVAAEARNLVLEDEQRRLVHLQQQSTAYLVGSSAAPTLRAAVRGRGKES